MDPREQRGLVIAAMCRLNRDGDKWLVPSQSADGTTYRVDPTAKTCTCPDHEAGYHCKHLYAVEITLKRETRPDGTIVETKSITFTEEKTTYPQNWTAYNRAQSIEKDRFQELLADLCSGLPEPERKHKGREPHSIANQVIAMLIKVYCGLSSRRVDSDLREAHRRGHLSAPVPGMKVVQFFENPALTPILKQLVGVSALPLRCIETDFAVDSSGFSTNKFETWTDQKYGTTKRKHTWIKTHICSGVRTNVVTAVRILDKDAADSPQFVPLVQDTAKGFTIGEISADKAYSSLQAFETVAECGGTAFIAFRENATGGIGGLFERMFHYFQFRREDFQEHYHKRSNVETTFSMIKRKFGDSVRSRNEVAMVNEVLAKIIAHNLCCLIQEQEELGIVPVFWSDEVEKAPQPEPLVIDVLPEDLFAELAFV